MSKLLTLRNVLLAVIAILIVFSVIQCSGNKKKKEEIAELQGYKEDYAILEELIDSLSSEHVRLKDSLPAGTIVKEPETNIQNQRKLLKTVQELQNITATNAKLRKLLNQADSVNALITQEQIKKGTAVVETVPFEQALPVFKTVKNEVGKHFVFEGIIFSRGELLSTEFNIDVTPEKIIIRQPGETQYLTKNNYLGLTGGVLSLNPDILTTDNLFVPLGLVYGRKFWQIDGTILTNTGFDRIEGAQLKLSAGLKW